MLVIKLKIVFGHANLLFRVYNFISDWSFRLGFKVGDYLTAAPCITVMYDHTVLVKKAVLVQLILEPVQIEHYKNTDTLVLENFITYY